MENPVRKKSGHWKSSIRKELGNAFYRRPLRFVLSVMIFLISLLLLILPTEQSVKKAAYLVIILLAIFWSRRR
jgi:hypothetical protein